MPANRTEVATPGAVAACLAALLLAFASPIAAEGSAGHGHYPHHTLGVFLGSSTEDRREEPRRGGTFGVEYEYRFSEKYGVGAVVEHVAGDLDVSVLAMPFAYHRGPWKMYAAPGVEFGHGEEEPLLRLGVEYGFHSRGFEISPQVDLDFVNGERVFVIGVVIARPL